MSSRIGRGQTSMSKPTTGQKCTIWTMKMSCGFERCLRSCNYRPASAKQQYVLRALVLPMCCTYYQLALSRPCVCGYCYSHDRIQDLFELMLTHFELDFSMHHRAATGSIFNEVEGELPSPEMLGEGGLGRDVSHPLLLLPLTTVAGATAFLWPDDIDTDSSLLRILVCKERGP